MLGIVDIDFVLQIVFVLSRPKLLLFAPGTLVLLPSSLDSDNVKTSDFYDFLLYVLSIALVKPSLSGRSVVSRVHPVSARFMTSWLEECYLALGSAFPHLAMFYLM